MEIEKLKQELTETRTEKENEEQTITFLLKSIEKLTPNEVEKHLLTYINWKNWKPTDYLTIKKELASKILLPQTQLREEYLAIKDKLLELVNSLLKEKDLEKQNEQKVKELAVKDKELSDLQTKYDMEVRSKEELIKFLNIYRNSNYLEYVVGTYNVEEEQKLFKDFIRQHSASLCGLSIRFKDRTKNRPSFVFDVKGSHHLSIYFLVLDFSLNPNKTNFELNLNDVCEYNSFSIRDELEFGSEGLGILAFRKMKEPKNIHAILGGFPIAYDGRIYDERGQVTGENIKLSSKAPVLYKKGDTYKGKILDHYKIVI